MNTDTTGQRIRYLRREKKLTQMQLAKIAGVSAPAVTEWEKDSYLPKAQSLDAVAKALGVTPDYLLTGKPSVEQQLQNKLDNSSIPTLTTEIDPASKVWVPLVDISFSCGTGESVEFHYEETKKMLSFEPDFFTSRNVKPLNTRLMYAIGDSMEMYIADGDVFAIDITDTTIRDGKIYAVYFEGEAMLKQIFKQAGGTLVLHSLNSKYQDKVITEENGQNFKVIGRQFWRAG